MLHRVELGTLRRQRFNPHIFRHCQVIRPVPTGSIQEHQDKLLRKAPRRYLNMELLKEHKKLRLSLAA